jgi:serine/threonine protein kinase
MRGGTGTEEHLNAPPVGKLESERRILSFKDYKGFKKSNDISKRYKMFQPLGKGSFGEVRRANHIRANVDCAVKMIKKSSI